jgi:hypothetical protein
VWDVFTATRYRLESVRRDWDMTYVRTTWTPAPRGPVSFGLDARFEWWGADGTLFWKKRVPTLPPFFFRFDHEASPLDWDFTNGAQAEAWVRWNTSRRSYVRLDGQLVVPWDGSGSGGGGGGTDGGSGPDDPEPSASRWGGLQLRVSAGADW